jgi:rhamnosyltransferase
MTAWSLDRQEPAMRQSEVCAIIVTYHPDQRRLQRVLERVSLQVGKVLVVDNGSVAASLPGLRTLTDSLGAELLEQGVNFGVAVGHNRGIDWAARHGYRYVLLLDQDSIPAADMVTRLITAHLTLTRGGVRVAAVGADYRRGGGTHASVFVRFGCLLFRRATVGRGEDRRWVSVDFLISSGSLLALSTVREIGPMEEGLFIDHVDTEWFLRARSLGYVAFGVPGARMEHELGEGASRLWLGRWREVPRYRPERYYYIFRNSLLLYRRQYAPRQWIRNDLVRLMGLSLYLLLLRSPRRLNARFISRGLRDGWHGRKGPLVGAGL